MGAVDFEIKVLLVDGIETQTLKVPDNSPPLLIEQATVEQYARFQQASTQIVGKRTG